MRRHPSHESRSCSHNTRRNMTFPFVSMVRLSRPLSLIRLIRNPAPCCSQVYDRLSNVHRQLSLCSSIQKDLLTSRTSVPMLMQQRSKKKKADKEVAENEKSDDEESDAEEEIDPDHLWDNIDTDVNNYQMDFVVRGVFHMSREKAMAQCDNGLVRLNGRIASKTDVVDAFDFVDWIRGRSPVDPDKLIVTRAEITHVSDHASSRGKAKLKAKKWRSVTIDNYPDGDPYEGVLQYREAEVEDWRGRVKTDAEK